MEFRSKPRTCCGAQQRPLGTRAVRHDDEELKGISSGRRGTFNVFLTSYVPSATTVAQARSVGAHKHEKKQSTTTMIGEHRVYKATAVYVRYSCVLSATAIGVASRTTRERSMTPSAGNLGFTQTTVVSVLCSVFYQRLPWRWLDPEAHPSHEKKQGTTVGNPGSLNNPNGFSVFCHFCVLSATGVTAPASIRESARQEEEAAAATATAKPLGGTTIRPHSGHVCIAVAMVSPVGRTFIILHLQTHTRSSLTSRGSDLFE